MWAGILQGAGALATAGATFYGAKKQAKIQKEMLEEQRKRDAHAKAKETKTQNNLDGAITDIYDEQKKKKKKDNLAGDIDLGQSYGA